MREGCALAYPLNMFSEQVQSSRDVQRDATRARVLTAAEELFGAQGFADTSIRQIAARAGVSVGTVMAAGDKGGLLVGIFDGWIAMVHDLRDSLPVDDSPLSHEALVAELAATFAPFVTYFAGDQDLAREYAATLVRGRHESTIFRGLGDRLIADVRSLLVRAGVARADETADAVYLAYLGVLMLASHGALSAEAASARLDATIRFLITTGESS